MIASMYSRHVVDKSNKVTYNGLITGSKDGLVVIWDEKLTKVGKIDIKDEKISARLNLNPKYKIIAVCESHKGNIVIGTRGSSILLAVKDANTGSYDV